MYEHFFELTAEPFRLSPGPDFCFRHSCHSQCLRTITTAITDGTKLVLVTGQTGIGKTTLIIDLCRQLKNQQMVVYQLECVNVANGSLLQTIAGKFGVSATETAGPDPQEALERSLREIRDRGLRAAILIDEAQNLSISDQQDIRNLIALNVDDAPLINICLIGQSGLDDLLQTGSLADLSNEDCYITRLCPIPQEEIRGYVEDRMRTVGWTINPCFSDAVFPAIYRFSEGIPRRVNLFCERLLLNCYVSQGNRISIADALTVAEELIDEQLSPVNILGDAVFKSADSYADEEPPEHSPVEANSPWEIVSNEDIEELVIYESPDPTVPGEEQ